MTTKEQAGLNKMEQQMRDNAYAISNLNDKMKAVDTESAKKALAGIIDYLTEKYNQV